MYRPEDFLIECQTCGDVIFYVPAENMALCQKWRNKVADNPYNYIVFCDDCIKHGYHIDKEYM